MRLPPHQLRRLAYRNMPEAGNLTRAQEKLFPGRSVNILWAKTNRKRCYLEAIARSSAEKLIGADEPLEDLLCFAFVRSTRENAQFNLEGLFAQLGGRLLFQHAPPAVIAVAEEP